MTGSGIGGVTASGIDAMGAAVGRNGPVAIVARHRRRRCNTGDTASVVGGVAATA